MLRLPVVFSSVFFIFLLATACAQKQNTVSAPVVAPKLTVAGCVSQTKQKMLQGILMPDQPGTNLDDEVSALNPVRKSQPRETEFDIEREDGAVTSQKVARTYGNGSDELEFSEDIKIEKSGTGEAEELFLVLGIKKSRRGYLVLDLEQTYRLNSHCEMEFQSLKRAQVQYIGSVATYAKQSYYSSGEVSPIETKSLSKRSLENSLEDISAEWVKKRANGKSMTAFFSWDNPEAELSIQVMPGKYEKSNPVTHLPSPSDGFELTIKPAAATKPIVVRVYTFPGIANFTLEWPDMGITGDSVDLSSWIQTPMGTARSQYRVEGFNDSDFLKPEARYTVTSNLPLKELRQNNYFSEVHQEDDSPGHYRYRVRVDLGDLAVDHLPKNVSLSSEEREHYLKATKFLQVKDPEIQRHAALIREGGRVKEADLALAVLKHTHQLMPGGYDYEMLANQATLRTLTTSEIIQRKKGVCQHFAALYVTLARAVGLPARMMTGLMLRTGVASGHGWVEVYMNSTWVEVEPQLKTDLRLSYVGYLPFEEDTLYETQPNEVEAIQFELDFAKLKIKVVKSN